jgi:hypothetical protein
MASVSDTSNEGFHFRDAAEDGDLEVLRAKITSGVNVNGADAVLYTACFGLICA